MEIESVKVLVLGAGPAGMTAALYAARAELQPVILTGTSIGGQAAMTHLIENYPGFPDGIGGMKLGELFQQQAERFGARFDFDEAIEADLSSRPYKIRTYSKEYQCQALIIATGANPNLLGIPGEKEFTGKGVSYCATCDGWFFKEKEVAVVGGGDSALEEALFLTRYASKVTVIHRRDAFRAGAILQTRVKENPKIHVLYDTVVKEVHGADGVEYLSIQNVKSGAEDKFKTDGFFVFIGHSPNTALFKGQLEMDEHNTIKMNLRMETSVEGVFACGESADPYYRQVVTSAGMGAAAAIQASRFLEHHS